MRSEIIRARGMFCCFSPMMRATVGIEDRSSAESASADYSNTTVVPHEYFCLTRTMCLLSTPETTRVITSRSRAVSASYRSFTAFDFGLLFSRHAVPLEGLPVWSGEFHSVHTCAAAVEYCSTFARARRGFGYGQVRTRSANETRLLRRELWVREADDFAEALDFFGGDATA